MKASPAFFSLIFGLRFILCFILVFILVLETPLSLAETCDMNAKDCCLSDNELKGLEARGKKFKQEEYGNVEVEGSRWTKKDTETRAKKIFNSGKVDPKTAQIFIGGVGGANKTDSDHVYGGGQYIVLPRKGKVLSPTTKDYRAEQLKSSEIYKDTTNPAFYYVNLAKDFSLISVHDQGIWDLVESARPELKGGGRSTFWKHFNEFCSNKLSGNVVYNGVSDWAVIRGPDSVLGIKDISEISDINAGTCDKVTSLHVGSKLGAKCFLYRVKEKKGRILSCSYPESLEEKEKNEDAKNEMSLGGSETAINHQNIPSTQDSWLQLIEAAEKQIDFNMSYLSFPDPKNNKNTQKIIEALKKKSQEGVKIRIFMDGNLTVNPLYDNTKNLPPEIEIIKSKKVSGAYNLHHQKSLIIDEGKLAYIGSGNFDANVLEGNVGDCGMVVSGNPAEEAFAVFKENVAAAVSPAPSSSSSSSASSSSQKLNLQATSATPQDVSLVCSNHKVSGGTTFDSLAKMIDGAKTSVDISMYQLHSEVFHALPSGNEKRNYIKEIYKKLDDACDKRGVKVNFLLDSTPLLEKFGPVKNSKGPFTKYITDIAEHLPNCFKGGSHNLGSLHVLHIPDGQKDAGYRGQVHSKFMVVDDQKSWIGSENWENSYFNGGDNCGLIADSPEIAKQLKEIISGYESTATELKILNGQKDLQDKTFLLNLSKQLEMTLGVQDSQADTCNNSGKDAFKGIESLSADIKGTLSKNISQASSSRFNPTKMGPRELSAHFMHCHFNSSSAAYQKFSTFLAHINDMGLSLSSQDNDCIKILIGKGALVKVP